MPDQGVIITLKKECADKDSRDKFKKEIIAQGGKVNHEYTLINAFAVSFPANTVHSLATHKMVQHVEQDGGVKTQ